MKGLGVRFRPNCTPVWVIQWRKNGRTVRRHLGELGVLKPEQARALACRIKSEHAAARPSRRRSVRFQEFAEQVLRDCRHRWKPATIEAHASGIKRNLIPFFRDMSVSEISRLDVANWRATPRGQCNRALAVLSTIFKHAEQLGLRRFGTNPCAGMRRKKSTFAANYPGENDYRRIGWALREAGRRQPELTALIWFLALSGTRRGQALQLQRKHINGSRAVLPDSKTGPCAIWLASPVRELLARLPNKGPDEYIFGTANVGKLGWFWTRLRHENHLPPLRLHDLRHGFASVAVASGEELRIVGLLLGHRDSNTTLGYAHLAERPISEAASRVSTHLSRYLDAGRNRNASRQSRAAEAG